MSTNRPSYDSLNNNNSYPQQLNPNGLSINDIESGINEKYLKPDVKSSEFKFKFWKKKKKVNNFFYIFFNIFNIKLIDSKKLTENK